MTTPNDTRVMQAELTTLRQRNTALSTALLAIVHETMDYPPSRPYSTDSYLPSHLIDAAQDALAYFDLDVTSRRTVEPSTNLHQGSAFRAATMAGNVKT